MHFAGYFCLFLLLLCGSLNVNAASPEFRSRLLSTLDVDVNNFLHCLRPELKGKRKEILLTIPSECEPQFEKLAVSWLDRPKPGDKSGENGKDQPKKGLWKRLFCKD